MTVSLLTGAGLLSPSSSSAPLFGFSSQFVIDATADYVRDVIGWQRTEQPWRFLAPCRGMRADVMRHRVQSRYSVQLSGGTVALVQKQTPYDSETAPWRSLGRQVQGLLWADDADAFREIEAPSDHPARVIREWSRRSRARMYRAIAEINHDTWTAEGTLAMVTLTLPNNWLAVAPTGSHFKHFLRIFRWRWEREIGAWQVVWKLEFQRRGAPHFHLMMKVPALVGGQRFESWLSETWADIVAADDDYCTSCEFDKHLCDCAEGRERTERRKHLGAGTNVDMSAKTTDPKRIAVYFGKHASKTTDSKEYQHIVPRAWRESGKGPGRFWGIAGLERHVVTVELDRETWIEMRRILRGVHRGNRARIALARRYKLTQQMSESSRRATLANLTTFGLRKDRIFRSANGGGWLMSNDSPALLHLVTQWLALRHAENMSEQVGEVQSASHVIT